MKRGARILLLLCAGMPFAASAQQGNDSLNDTERAGRQLLAQNCGVCHLPPAFNARTFGPRLSKDTAGGMDVAIRQIITEGTQRMPAFKHNLQPTQIDSIIAYLKTVPTPPPQPAQPARASAGE
jgi:mono/diheme cytochrome c family protein